jgi:CubicO group peptidase (beta-lactamase class C family)
MKSQKKLKIVTIIFLMLFNGIAFSQDKNQSESQERAIDSFIKSVLKKDINTEAAIAIAVIDGKNISFEKVYGKRDVLRNLEATVNTPFYIASATKSFMCALVLSLQDEGVMDINLPISNYLGNEFQFKNKNLDASAITISDLLTHQSGIENNAITWRTAYTGEDGSDNDVLLELFKNSDFNENPFKYTNNGYILSGIILEKITGKSWKKLLQERIFNEIGMSKTSANPYSAFQYDEPALGHQMKDGKTILGKAQKQNENSHAAGGVFSSLFDLEKWLFLNMNEGNYNGNQVFSKELVNKIHTV